MHIFNTSVLDMTCGLTNQPSQAVFESGSAHKGNRNAEEQQHYVYLG